MLGALPMKTAMAVTVPEDVLPCTMTWSPVCSVAKEADLTPGST